MTDKIHETIKEEISKLSKEKREAINSVNWEDITEEIAHKYLLTEDEINKLQLETGLFLIGLVNSDMYKLRVEDVLVSSTITENITNEILKKVFTPITEKIESSIKNKIKTQIIKWSQSVNFIVSGGDYSSFIEKRQNE